MKIVSQKPPLKMYDRLAHRVARSSQATPAAVDKSSSASNTKIQTAPLFLARRIADVSAELLQAIVHQRYKLRRAIVITSNRVVQDWGKYLGDATMASTILDRLMHRCAMLEFEGKSYRLKEAASRIIATSV